MSKRVLRVIRRKGKTSDAGNFDTRTTIATHVNPLARSSNLYPLNAPGIPIPGPDFLRLAKALGDDTELTSEKRNATIAKVGERLEYVVSQVLTSAGSYTIPMTVKGTTVRPLKVVTGHKWAKGVTGPVPADVMVIGKMLGEDELRHDRNMMGPTGQLLKEVCEKYHIPVGSWYVTNLIKTEHPEGRGTGTLRQSCIKEWLPILHQELRIVKPKYILCLGADASKALLGKHASVAHMEGRVVEYKLPMARCAEESPTYHVIQVMTSQHPAAVLRAPENTDKFENSIVKFGQLIKGLRWDREEEDLDHRVIDNLDDLKLLEKEIERDCEDNLIAVDAEWHGEHPQNAGAYMRCVQLSWKPKAAACISLRHPGGAVRFEGGIEQALYYIQRIVKGRRIAGHFLNADMEWLEYNGVSLRKEFAVASTWERCMTDAIAGIRGGIDTGLAAHAVDETADFSLTGLTLRYTTAPRYDVKLSDWKKDFCNKHKIKAKDLDGYGDCPDAILEPYANYDADVTRRCAKVLQRLMCHDRFGNNCWEPFWANMRANPGVLEINTTGLKIDRKRVDRLTASYMRARTAMLQRLREYAHWPELNPASVQQVREFLFGEEYNGKIHEPGTPPVRLRPPEALTLRLQPILTTDKRPMPWTEVVERGLEAEKSPSTDKMALAILAQEAQQTTYTDADGSTCTRDLSDPVMMIRDYRFISQILKSVLREPITDDDANAVLDAKGNKTYASGLPAAICSDGKVRTTIYPTKETGRWSSSRPALQNISKRREADYKRILGEEYLYPIRTIIRAPPGHVLIEADYVGAELFAMAILSGDKAMINHARRNQLPETDPDFYDIHSNVAVLAFDYDCPPTKGGLASIGKKHMRIVAKSVEY